MIILSFILCIIILSSERVESNDKKEVTGCRIIGILGTLLVYRILYLEWIPIELALVLFALSFYFIIKPKYIKKEISK